MKNLFYRRLVEYIFRMGLFLSCCTNNCSAKTEVLSAGCADTKSQVLNGLLPISDSNPIRIKTQFYVEDVNSINALDMDFRLDYFLWHSWNVSEKYCDQYRSLLCNLGLCTTLKNSPIVVSKNHLDNFWIPDTYATNAKSVYTPSYASSTKVLRITLRDSGTCEMEYTIRLAAVVACQMEFKQYPVDVQTCPFTMRSYAYPFNTVRYEWTDSRSGVLKNQDLKLLQHNLELRKQESTIWTLDVKYSTVSVEFRFERQIAHHLMQVFAPSALIVTLSWLSFWMGLDAIPGRVTLCVTSLLALFTQFSGIRGDLPPASYINGTDIWMATCMLFVFATLMEFVVVKFLDKRKQLYFRSQIKNSFSSSESGFGSTVSLQLPQASDDKIILPKEVAPRFAWNVASQHDSHQWFKPPSWSVDWVVTIDYSCRLLFPASFLVFNTVYWPVLLNRHL
ncbi:glycine receptor subunit alpha-2-like isoform X1 [Limulus polyphemus]|uniref:Glycine receptor subunit alpha-2-like isoform X1 n=1 Tax=Limulus polyphemus TaxID=6850 RepID=A0ABM1TIQ2_LIMPO|nr:glycine receptor subunit alpha-2-like isoform X1 [Limulus polyphemus]